jgi:N-acetylglucosaminyldiphosphoundecaprenol N-acetyl-beta-D-mannosaminyltransferase
MKNCSDVEIAFLGIKLTPLTIPQLNGKVSESIKNQSRNIIANHNFHSLYLCQHDQKLRRFFDNAAWTHIDGMSLVFIARFLGYRIAKEKRVTYVDWLRPLMAEAKKNDWRVFFLGSRPGVGEASSKILVREYSGLNLCAHHGYFDCSPGSEENQRILSIINSFRPNILMVGMGMPRQEHWILDNLESLDANVILPAGACMDYVAGTISTPPRWMGRVGLEWLYRLISEPKRLGRRYLVEPWFMAGLLLKEISQHIVGKRQAK